MKRLLTTLLVLSFVLTPFAQKKNSKHREKARTTQIPVRKKTSTPASGKRKGTEAKPQRAATARTKTSGNRQSTPASKQQASTTRNRPRYSNSSIRGLEGQRAAIQKKIKEQEQALRANQEDVKKRLQDLLVINSEIDQSQKSIEGIQRDIVHINGNIGILKSQLQTLEQQLEDRKAKYIRSLRYMSRHHSVQERLMFVFSADNFAQMYRRMRFIRQYAGYQKAQGELVKAKQSQVTGKHEELKRVKGAKNSLLYKGRQEKSNLENKKAEQQNVVQGLQKQQRTIQSIIAQQRQKDAALNAQIDRLIAEEVAKARARAAAEARRKAAAEAAAKKRAEELARRKAAAEAAARENARRIQEAKEREARLKAEAEAAAKAAEEARKAQAAAAEARKREAAEAAARSAAERRARAEQAAREAEAARVATERKAEAEKKRNEAAIAEAREEAHEAATLTTVDRMMNNGFEANRGRLPMPITGSYRVVSHFGQHSVEGLPGVTLDNKGINILGSAGASARAIYDGEVSAVLGFGGSWVVMVRHGVYISVYANLKSVSVHRGQKVSTRQGLGIVGNDNILQFQLRKETAKLNPEVWLGR